jgi:hypothetical protein
MRMGVCARCSVFIFVSHFCETVVGLLADGCGIIRRLGPATLISRTRSLSLNIRELLTLLCSFVLFHIGYHGCFAAICWLLSMRTRLWFWVGLVGNGVGVHGAVDDIIRIQNHSHCRAQIVLILNADIALLLVHLQQE